ncbi:AraC family transcriptional regulator [Ramlibacter sp.]|uniref:AraC family transcriptional regulator n=1 Tax=Ramlibacter sp. TaxID=1917967 RepID=UPI0017AC0B3F|nr:AraC family transcriptional regulator [Ramlibacter sp.]MBA2673482.1 AraC family transcriptional regulator [Ramlibacter sp.]
MNNTAAPVDRLAGLLERFRLRAHLFHQGPLCGVTHFDAKPGRGFLHVLRAGEMVLTHQPRTRGVARRLAVREPTLLFYPRPLAHDFHNAPAEGCDFVCASLDWEGGEQHPLARALPALVVVPLARVPMLGQTLELLFAETRQLLCGQRLVADRLFEVLVLQLLRWLLDHPAECGLPAGLLTGLAHPKLARALVALHDAPAQAWNLDAMARVAGMSRSAFAACFREQVGEPPAEYLMRWRIALFQQLLRAGQPVKTASLAVGYSPNALTRAFTAEVGMPPRAWLASLGSEG